MAKVRPTLETRGSRCDGVEGSYASIGRYLTNMTKRQFLYPPNLSGESAFPQLLSDAFEQLAGHNRRQVFYILPKVPSSMMTAATADSNQPWIFEDSATITEAFDPFLGLKPSLVDIPFAGYSDTNSFIVAQSINRHLDFGLDFRLEKQ
jgi:hypothetical protein